MCVYFIQEVPDGAIKVGYTARNPEKRLNDLKTGNSRSLSLLGSIEGDEELERRLHRLFAQHHKNLEWFHPDPFVVETISQLLYGKVPPEVERQLYDIIPCPPEKERWLNFIISRLLTADPYTEVTLRSLGFKPEVQGWLEDLFIAEDYHFMAALRNRGIALQLYRDRGDVWVIVMDFIVPTIVYPKAPAIPDGDF